MDCQMMLTSRFGLWKEAALASYTVVDTSLNRSDKTKIVTSVRKCLINSNLQHSSSNLLYSTPLIHRLSMLVSHQFKEDSKLLPPQRLLFPKEIMSKYMRRLKLIQFPSKLCSLRCNLKCNPRCKCNNLCINNNSLWWCSRNKCNSLNTNNNNPRVSTWHKHPCNNSNLCTSSNNLWWLPTSNINSNQCKCNNLCNSLCTNSSNLCSSNLCSSLCTNSSSSNLCKHSHTNNNNSKHMSLKTNDSDTLI